MQVTDSEFETLADAALQALERAFEASLPDADLQAKWEPPAEGATERKLPNVTGNVLLNDSDVDAGAYESGLVLGPPRFVRHPASRTVHKQKYSTGKSARNRPAGTAP